jgi:hypothetical protein
MFQFGNYRKGLLGSMVPSIGPGMGPAAPTGPGVQLDSSGMGMDVMGSLKSNSDFATRFRSNPGSGPWGY